MRRADARASSERRLRSARAAAATATGKPDQIREVAFGPGHRSVPDADGERKLRGGEWHPRRQAWSGRSVNRMRHVRFRERMIACRPGLGADRDHEMSAQRDQRLQPPQRRGCGAVDAIVEISRCRRDVRDPGEITPQLMSESSGRHSNGRARSETATTSNRTRKKSRVPAWRRAHDGLSPDPRPGHARQIRSPCHQDPHQAYFRARSFRAACRPWRRQPQCSG